MSLRTKHHPPCFHLQPLEPRINLSTVLASAVAHAHRRAAIPAVQHHPAPPPPSVTAIDEEGAIPVTAFTKLHGAHLASRHGTPFIAASSAKSYMDYTVDVAAAGTYTFTLTTSATRATSLTLFDNGANLGAISLVATPKILTTTDASLTITLSAGPQTLRLASTRNTSFALFALHFVEQLPVTTQPATPAIPSSGSLPIDPTPDPITPFPVTPPDTGGLPITPVTDSPLLSAKERSMSSFTEFDVLGLFSNLSISVTQSGNIITVTCNAQVYQNVNPIGDLVLYAGAGNATITVDSSVTVPTRIYTGSGSDTILNNTRAQATIVSLGGGSDTITGNGINTAYWVDPTDIVNASAAELANHDVHVITSFYQPYTSTPGAPGYVTTARDGANLTDPAAAVSATTRLTKNSFFGAGPTQADIVEGQAADCFYLTCLQSLARLEPARLYQMGVDLGDGTFAVQYLRNGTTTYVRVDADLPLAPWNGLYYASAGPSGNQWVPLFEKAYAYFRTGANSYASLDNGYMTNVWYDFNIPATSNVFSADQNAFYNTATAALAAGKPVDVLTHATINNAAPLISSHCYAVISLTKDANGTVRVTLRNPWGTDGFVNDDSNPTDGFVTVDYASLYADATYFTIATV